MSKAASAEIGHNSDGIKDKIQDLAVRYAKCDEQSQELNQERAEIREEISELGLDTKAWQDEINRAKQGMKKREGYDESKAVIRDALGEMKMEDLFAHVLRKEQEKEATRVEKAKDREKASAAKKAAKKANDDTFKPATERAPSEVRSVGKMAAAGEA